MQKQKASGSLAFVHFARRRWILSFGFVFERRSHHACLVMRAVALGC